MAAARRFSESLPALAAHLPPPQQQGQGGTDDTAVELGEEVRAVGAAARLVDEAVVGVGAVVGGGVACSSRAETERVPCVRERDLSTNYPGVGLLTPREHLRLDSRWGVSRGIN